MAETEPQDFTPLVQQAIAKSEETAHVALRGRPRTKLLSYALKDALAQSDGDLSPTVAEQIAKRITGIATEGKDGHAIAAFHEIADRTEGKAIQAVAIQHSIDPTTAAALVELAEALTR